MTKSAETTLTTPSHLVADTSGVRYERVAKNQTNTPEQVERHGRIVVGIDGSEGSIAALRRAVSIATALHTSVQAISTWRLPTGYTAVGDYSRSPLDDANEILSEAAAAVFDSPAPDWFTTEAFEGNPADILIEQSRGAEMLIVGSRGHGGIAGLLLGSVSAVCAERAHCSVLIIHQDDAPTAAA